MSILRGFDSVQHVHATANFAHLVLDTPRGNNKISRTIVIHIPRGADHRARKTRGSGAGDNLRAPHRDWVVDIENINRACGVSVQQNYRTSVIYFFAAVTKRAHIKSGVLVQCTQNTAALRKPNGNIGIAVSV